ncbi:GroES-like protein [Aspergillus karnatakaensis]|uniref:zinc-binding alcohol dehydrogenase family protein n=1 Tax=Aspergillus karnatakaensis TaxID=1810916 RepID=UPI003CCDA42E
MMTTSHLAAFCPGKGQPLHVESRLTPHPGPGELLIAVKSIALNPADHIMRDTGLFIPSYPTVLGFDLAGLVIEVGEDVPSPSKPTNDGIAFEAGTTRVAAYAAHCFRNCNPDYGAFQEKVLVPWQHALILPDGDKPSWNEAATLPVSIQVPLSAWDAMGIPRADGSTLSSSVSKNEALLIWGASSSVGSMGVQLARILRDSPGSAFRAVYAVAGGNNLEYVASLGADQVFDYNDPDVVSEIVTRATQDSLVVKHCFLARGDLEKCQAVLNAFVENGQGGTAKIGSAPPVPLDADRGRGIESIFLRPAAEEHERLEQFEYWLGLFGRDMLAKGAIRPSPGVRVVGRGLEAVNEGLDELVRGVSCVKLVVEIAE